MGADDAEPGLLPLPRLVEAAVLMALLLALLAAGAASLVLPGQAVTALDIVLAVAVVQGLLLRSAPCAALTVTSVAVVALPAVMRRLWQGTGLPTILDDALAAIRQVPVHHNGFGSTQISPVPGIPGTLGLVAAVACVLAVTGAARAFRTAVWGRRLAPSAVPQQAHLGDTLLPLPVEVQAAADWTPPPEPLPSAAPPAPPARLDRLVRRPLVRRLLVRRLLVRRPRFPGPLFPRPLLTGTRSRAAPLAETVDPTSHPADDSWRHPAGSGPAGAPTVLPGREGFLDRLRAAAHREDLVGGGLAVFVVEVDRLDGLLDALGRSAGQDVVRQVARRLQAWLPRGADAVARLGSGSFAVLVEDTGGDCEPVARRMSALLAEPMSVTGQTVSVSFSIGIAEAGSASLDPTHLLAAAQDAATQAARSGRARWVRHDGAARAGALADGRLELELRHALRHRQIRAVFQPIVRLGRADRVGSTDRPIAVEALARWTTRAGASVEPARFVALAEQVGLGPELGRQVLECGLDAVAGWYAEGYPVGRLSVNLAQSQLDSPDLVELVTGLLARRDLPGGCLVVELAAGGFSPTTQTVRTLAGLTGLGIQVLLDDFGVPGVSVAGLSELPLSGVKLDRSLTVDLSPVSPAAAAVALCRSLGLRSIAEGIETVGQLAEARALRVDAVQGYLLGRPARARDLTAALAAAAGPARAQGGLLASPIAAADRPAPAPAVPVRPTVDA